MAGKADFSEQEWETLQKGATGAGLLVSIADRGFFDSFKEAGALAKHLVEARKSSSSDLVRDLAETRGTGFGVMTSPADLERDVLAALAEAKSTLQAKAPEDVDEYREFVVGVAQSVAAAAGGGETTEGGAVEKIRAALT